MNPKVRQNCIALDEIIGKATSIAAAKMMAADLQDAGESVEAMDMITDVLASNHQSAIAATVGSLLELNRSDGTDLPHDIVRKYIQECESSFTTNLRSGISKMLKESGLPDILDPNAKLREDIENGNL